MSALIALVARHGQTQLNQENCFRSWLDVPLDATGISQAHMAAQFMARMPIRNVISSPLLRAFVTADIESQPHKLQVFQHRGLFPWRLGIFSGESKEKNQEALDLFVKNPKVCIPDGESLKDFEDRQFAFWHAALKRSRSAGLTLFVCHTSNVVALQTFAEGGDKVEPEGVDTVEPGGIAAVYANAKGYRVEPIFGRPKSAEFGGS